MMPILPFWWNLAGLLLCLAGFALLVLATEREGPVLLHRVATARERLAYRLFGWPLLAASLWLSVIGWRGNFGPVLWFGWVTVAAFGMVFSITYWPWRHKRKAPASRAATRSAREAPAISAMAPGSVPIGLKAWRTLLGFGLAALPAAVAWSLYHAPVHPLLRADAVQGQVGPWTFTLVEEEQGGPESTSSGTLVKHLMLRFCDACDGDIRAAYLQLREPRSPHSLGIRFMGERWEREATLPIPAVITPQDHLWLTVVDKDGQLHRAALARSIEEQSR